jgi:hypothetical protein
VVDQDTVVEDRDMRGLGDLVSFEARSLGQARGQKQSQSLDACQQRRQLIGARFRFGASGIVSALSRVAPSVACARSKTRRHNRLRLG